MAILSTVARLSITPIKGLALQHPATITMTKHGAEGDRRFFLVDASCRPISITRLAALARFGAEYESTTNVLTIRDDEGRRWSDEASLGPPVTSLFPDRGQVPARAVEGPWSEVLTDAADHPVRLLRVAEHTNAYDVHPATILGTASVAELGRRSGLSSVDSRRFRMLIELTTDTPHVEDTWAGRRARLGTAEFLLGGPVPRCAAVTRHPDTGIRDAAIVTAIKAYRGIQEGELGRGVHFGVYADIATPGAITVGDRLEFIT